MIDQLPHSRAIRVVILAALLLAIVQRAPAVAWDAHGIAFAGCLAVAVAAWLAWTWGSPRWAFPLLLAVAVAGALAAGVGADADLVAVVLPALAAAVAGEQLRPRLAVVVAAAGALSLAVASALADEGALAALALVVPASGLLAGLARRQYVLRAEQAELLLAETQRTHEEQARAAALDERLRIAREVHDVLAHSLSGLAIQLELAQALLAERGDIDGALERIERSQQLTADGLADARDAVSALRGEVGPLPARLGRFVDDYRAETGASATFAVSGPPRPLSAEADLALRRVTQESLTNVRRHAAGAAVEAQLDFGPSETVLTVRDIGPRRFAGGDGGGYGIAGMRERAALLGGRLEAGPAEDGWQVQLRIPA